MDAKVAKPGESIRLAVLWSDPYPIYARLRREEPIAWVPAANRYLFTRHEDIVTLERQPEVFSANEENSLMKRVMGHTRTARATAASGLPANRRSDRPR